MIKCGHCKGVHRKVTQVYICSSEHYARAAIAAEEEAQAHAEWLAEQPRSYVIEPDFEALAESGGLDDCPHGLSQWLCADPVNHYPSDNDLDRVF